MKDFYSPTLIGLLFFSFSMCCFAGELYTDSTKTQKKEKKYATTVITRVHSLGFFSYTGRLISDNPAADIYFNYNRSNKWGLNVFKAFDLYDHTSDNNFMMMMVNRNFPISKKLSVNLYGGAVLEQTHHFAGHGSDVVVNVISSYKLSPHLTLDHTALFGNLIIEKANTDWVNRVRLLYSKNHIDVTAWSWFNNKIIDQTKYSSVGLSLYYSRIPLSDRWKISTGVTGLVMLNTSDENKCPEKNGMLLTIAATWH